MNPFKIWIKVGIFQLTFTHIHTFNLGKNSAFILLNFKFPQQDSIFMKDHQQLINYNKFLEK